MHKLTCILIEDEEPAQIVLQSYLKKVEWVELVSVFTDGIDAIDYLKDHEVDLIILDIQIPWINGIELLKIMKNPPQVIITTAYSHYAVEAFDLDVRDYLMKPISFERFVKALTRVSAAPEARQIHLLQPAESQEGFAFFNVNKMMVRVSFDDIRFIESMKEYIYIHVSNDRVITKLGIGEAEKMLSRNFLRVHRSFIVNLEKITAYNAEEIFIGKVSIPIGTNYKKSVEAVLTSRTLN